MTTKSSAHVTFVEAPPIPTYNPVGSAQIITAARGVAGDHREDDEPDLVPTLLARVRALIRSAGSGPRLDPYRLSPKRQLSVLTNQPLPAWCT